jgi:hypothetical protein
MTSIDHIVLIIIDQLRADYARYLPRCSEVLPYYAVCDTNSIPTSTEAMHANISTGKYPREHGFISKRAKGGEDGLVQFETSLIEGCLSSLASAGRKLDFEVYVIGGKPETVRVMGLKGECALSIYYDRDLERFRVGGAEDYSSAVEKALDCDEYKKLPRHRLDDAVIKIFRENIITRSTAQKSLFILTLSSLDDLGHKFGPCSTQIEEHLRLLDDQIHPLVKGLGANTVFIVTGDHGCRETAKYLVETDDADPRRVTVYQVKGNLLEFHEEHHLDPEGNLRDIQYDGGILRIWFNSGVASLSGRDVAFLSKYGRVCCKDDVEEIDKGLREIYRNSSHENIGDVVITANGDATFCKRSWILRQSSIEAIAQRGILQRGDLPIGEHGTPLIQDREVLLMSNYEFGISMPSNTHIRQVIEKVMAASQRRITG